MILCVSRKEEREKSSSCEAQLLVNRDEIGMQEDGCRRRESARRDVRADESP